MLETNQLALKDIFSNRFAFRVPLYQRPYSWGSEQVNDLFDDLCTGVHSTGSSLTESYFLGSVVLVKRPDFPEADIVDGQQRLTTLTLLLAVLRRTVPDEAIADFLLEKKNIYQGTSQRFRLELRQLDRQFLWKLIETVTVREELFTLTNQRNLSEAQQRLAGNMLLLWDRVEKLSATDRQVLATYITIKCFLVVVSTADFESAYRIFSVLNNRGLDLTPADILKAEIIGKVPRDREQEFVSKWEKLEVDLGRDDFQSLFSHLRSLVRKSKLSGTLLEEVRLYLRPTEDPVHFIDHILLPYGEAYQTILNQSFHSDQIGRAINRVLRWLSRIDNADWVPAAMQFVIQFSTDSRLLLEHIHSLERLAAALMLRSAYRNERAERYGRVLQELESGANLLISGSSLQLTAEECSQTIRILDGPLYSSPKQCLYVLQRLDEEFSTGDASYDHKVISIEHVLPQTPSSDSEWMSHFKPEEHEELLHKLGNLVLLSRKKNAKAQNSDFAIKKAKYFELAGGVSPFVITTQVLQEPIWTPAAIRARQTALLARLRTCWRLNK